MRVSREFNDFDWLAFRYIIFILAYHSNLKIISAFVLELLNCHYELQFLISLSLIFLLMTE